MSTRRPDPAERGRRQLAALDAAVRGIAGELSLERVLQLIVDRVRGLADAEYAALGIVDAAGGIERFITSGISAAHRARIGPLPRGQGLLGLIIRENRAFRIRDIATDPRRYGFPPHHPPMHAFLGVPITVKGRSAGNLYLTNRHGGAEFTEADQRLVEMFALHAGIAIENARLHEEVRRLAVVEERERIGRDLHDGVIQSLYAVTLSLDDVEELVTIQPREAARRVDDAIDALHATIRDIRNFVFGLRPGLLDEGGLVGALEGVVNEVQRNAALDISLDATEIPEPPLEISAQLLAIVREALSNVARHAGATHATVTLRGDAAGLTLEVSDDGQGFDPTAVHGRGNQGLANMRSRTERLDGTLTIDAAPGRGSRIIASVALPPRALEADR